tara:strand:- start:179 stop:493 length:315 start_codon:yes stop_codon:yes gene_type:complete
MKYYFNLFVLLFISFFLNGCSGLKESLSLKKKEGVDEFLIERKKPLTVPPDFTSLPKPSDTSEVVEKKESNLDLKKVLKETQKNGEVKSSNNLEKSISDILNKR